MAHICDVPRAAIPGARAFRIALLCAALAVGYAPLSPTVRAQTLDDGLQLEIERAVGSLVDSVPWPGAAVGIVRGDTLAYAGGFGVMSRRTGEPVTSETLFQIGSVTKSFTSTLAGMLSAEGRLAWSDLLAERLPAGTVMPATPITLGQLASHTSGLPHEAPTLRRVHGDYPILAFTHFELYRSLAESEVVFEPGTAWGYSNFGYAVLGNAIEVLTGEPYETLLTKELFGPLTMRSSTVTVWPELAGRLATPYIEDERTGELVEYTPWDMEALAPAGGIASTLSDLGRWVAFQMRAREGGEERLPAAVVRDLQSAHWSFPAGNAYGRGWFVERMKGVGEVVSVGGEVDGYTSEIAIASDCGIGAIVLTNRGDATGLPDLARWLLARVCGGEGNTETLIQRGFLHQAAREWTPAFDAFEESAARDSTDGRSLYQVGRTGALSGLRPEEAGQALERYLARSPIPGDVPHGAARWRLGMVHQRAGRCAEAEEQYALAIDEDPSLAEAIEQDRRAIGGCSGSGQSAPP